MGDQNITRRRLLGTAGAAGAAGVLAGGAGGAAGYAAADPAPAALTSVGADAVAFHGTAAAPQQAGITTPAQAVAHLVAFDLAAGADRARAAALLRRWSRAAEAMTAGRAPDDDDQVALDAGPSSLTVTFGFGRSFFSRTGLTSRLPADFTPIPPFSSDALDPARGGGDLWIQIGADDPLVAFHALRVLQRAAAGTAAVRWQMNGFSRTPGATAKPRTVRNLMGQVDGTNNPKPADHDFRSALFVAGRPGGQAWMNGGSYAVVRRIRMLLDPWEQQPLARQEAVIGRRKSDGAPLSGGTESTPVDLDRMDRDGTLAVAGDAHIRVAAAQSNDGAKMLRRPFSFHDGFDPDGTPDAGLLFVAWQAAPLNGFIKVQRKLDSADALSRFIRHESSALFAVPPAARPGEYVGQGLLEG
ncbi:iron uptake transporter deferrochelatase/peroxidase subunit [Streptantibioticus silvisoli]|uniref:Deferrochelatase n=1 Tax=Streptantibioticus silvisoli TaxID=2705255 RepID=A0ABT6W3I4_9ACTN|nr:iron uptake transporter deferrochelatase/peroxidase subunit [Streptantibioticus silvisoli]MDI5964248.1 iron uptake transporter deferrochelatase/peroxidase subunit [Streptantibioticus silvisoli]